MSFLEGSRKAIFHERKLSVNENGVDDATSRPAFESLKICCGPTPKEGVR